MAVKSPENLGHHAVLLTNRGCNEIDTARVLFYGRATLITSTSMHRSPRSSHENAPAKLVIASLAVGVQFLGFASAQNLTPGSGLDLGPSLGGNFASRLADSIPVRGYTRSLFPSSNLVSGSDLELGLDEEQGPAEGQKQGQGLKGAFLYGAGLSTTYDTNFFLDEDNAESELTTSLYGAISYFSDPEGGAPVSIVASYNPAVQFYLENSENNGLNNSGNVKLTLAGGRSVASAYVNLVQTSGTDPVIGEFVSETLLSAGVEGSYQLAPRTSIAGSFSAATTDFGEDDLEGSNVYSTYLSGSWAATEYLSFGPMIQYIQSTSDNSGTRDAWQFLMQAQYQVGARIRISGSLGLDYATDSRDEGDASAGLAGNFNATYVINDRLSWSGSVLYVTVPSPDEADYVINNLTVASSLNRKFLRATVDVGLAFNIASYEAVGPAAAPLNDDNNLNLFATYSRSVFQERVNFVSTAMYSVNDGQSDWDQVQLTVALNAEF